MIEELLAYSIVDERTRRHPGDEHRRQWHALARLGRGRRRQPELAPGYEKPVSTYIPTV